jgi:hypothetical protein
VYFNGPTVKAENGPKNHLQVEKVWRGVPDTTGYPDVTFTLYQGWQTADGTVSSNGGESWKYVNEHTGDTYENIKLTDGQCTVEEAYDEIKAGIDEVKESL